GIWKLRFLGFTVGEAGGAGRVVQPEALQKLGIVVELAPVPQLEAKKGAGGPRRSGLRPGRKAVDAEVRRVKWRGAPLGGGGLFVGLPIWGLGLGGGERGDAGRGGSRLGVEAAAGPLDARRGG